MRGKMIVSVVLCAALAGTLSSCGEGDDCVAQCAGASDPAACEQQCLPFDDNSAFPEEPLAGETPGQIQSPASQPPDDDGIVGDSDPDDFY